MQRALHPLAPPLLISALSLLAACFVLAAPETKGRPLPEDLADFDEGPLLKRLPCGRRAPAAPSTPSTA